MASATQSGSPPTTLLRLRELRSRLKGEGVLNAVDEQLAQELPSEPARVSGPAKIVKDLVWGIIRVPGFLVPLVDSQMLQRQRRIRQLGLSYLVYPAAGHSRFEHALGCMHVASELLKAIAADRNVEGLTTDRQNQLLLGALLHDVGHMPFSHASERCLQESSVELRVGPWTVERIQRELATALNRKLLPIAELISILVLMAPRFQRFMERIAPRDDEPALDFFLEIAAFVGGARLSNDTLAYTMVLSGPLDADRLDYMRRDSYHTGVPVSVDISRLLARCAFVRFPAGDLPESRRDIWGPEDATLFVTDMSGANALEEMAVSRFMLYDRVYHHQKTQAAEALLTELIEKCFEHSVISTELLSFWAMSDESFLHKASSFPETQVLARRLLNRELPKRAAIYASSLVEEPVVCANRHTVEHHDEENSESKDPSDILRNRLRSGMGDLLDALDESARESVARRNLEQKIINLAREIAQKVPKSYVPDGTSLRTVHLRARPRSPFSKLGEALVTGVGGVVTEFHEHMPLAPWSAAYDINKKFGWVFTDAGWEDVVRIAAELVLYRELAEQDAELEFRFSLSGNADLRAKRSPQTIYRLKELLDEHSYYDDAWKLRPVCVAPPRIEDIGLRFRAFQGAGGWRVDDLTVTNFLRQFPIRLQEQAARLLEEMSFLDRNALSGAMARQLGNVQGSWDAGMLGTVVALTPNSGALLRMLAQQDLQSRFSSLSFQGQSLGSLPKDDNSAIVLIDDLLGTGSQSITQLQAWMGVPKDDRHDPCEKNIDDSPLSEPIAEALRARPVRALFALATDSGKAALERAAADLKLADFRVLVDAPLAPVSLRAKYGDDLVNYMEDVGSQVLTHCRGGDGSRSTRDALGYSGVSHCVASIFNVPTCCPAALWCPGPRGGTTWVPVFIRRGYQPLARFV